ncbi:MAG: FAD-dependent monooxygenase [Phycisphaerales bacterium]|nr:MAG: FAD-dependent monooxygenase [Phycisphaerales bacterium]
MTAPAKPPITIFGAGLSGALLAVRLARAGFDVELHERRPDPRATGAEGGRSINLALSARGLHALEQVGLADKIRAQIIPMRGRMIHPVRGPLAYQSYSPRGDQAINSVSRAGLNLALLEAAAREDRVNITFDSRCRRVNFETMETIVEDTATGATRSVTPEVVIGADGAFSAVRASMQIRDRFNYQQSYESHGYKELTIPPGEGADRFRIDKHALHIWPRRSYMMIALPNNDGSFTCTLFAPFEGPDGFDNIRTPADLRAYFERRFPDALPLLPTLEDDFFRNPTGSLVTVRCFPWRIGGRAALIGDAAHAVVPFYGQGMNASFEDVVALGDRLEQHPHDTDRAFALYEADRKPHADALAQLAIDNFIEMRDKVGSPAFRRKKQIEHALARAFPRAYLPLYTMVSFSTIPYADAVQRANVQDRIVRAAALLLCALIVIALALLARAIFK